MAALANALGCRQPPAQSVSGAPSVLLITIDTLRPDRLSCYGYQARQTPHLDALAGDGVLFERALCDVPWTTGSMASVMTGRYASHHLLRLSTERLSDASVTLAEVLREHAYATGAIIGSFPLASIYNLNQGFQTYDESFDRPMAPGPPEEPLRDEHGRALQIKKVPPVLNAEPEAMQRYFAEKVSNDACRPDNEVTDRAIAWLQEHRDDKFFLWVHYFGPHERVNLFETWQQQSPRVIAEYDRDLAFTDAQVGRLLDGIDRLGLREHSLVVLHADHGQSLGENDYVGHGDNLYQPSLHIPLLMRFPGRLAAGARVGLQAQNVDILPTILGLVGIDAQLPLDGTDLSPHLRAGASVPANTLAYSETFLSTIEPHQVTTSEYGPMTVRLVRHGLLHGDRMYVVNELRPPCTRAGDVPVPDAEWSQLRLEELFDPFADPQGLSNLAGADVAVLSWFREHIDAYRAPAGGKSEPAELSPGQKEKLRALGYGS